MGLGRARTSHLDGFLIRIAASEAPLLRRLAIHTLTITSGISPDDRLQWLLIHMGLHSHAEHHELYRAVAMCYPAAGDKMREAVVKAVMIYESKSFNNLSAEECSAHEHFKWLSWLILAKADCQFANDALAPIKARYPQWKLDHPDFTHWSDVRSTDWVGSQSPWTLDELLARDPREQINDLLSFQGDRFVGPSRDGLLRAIHEACKQNTAWGFALVDTLVEGSHIESDLWSAILTGLPESELSVDAWRNLLAILSQQRIYLAHSSSIALLLRSLVQNEGRPFALEVLEQANELAFTLWQSLESAPDDENITDWLHRAINRPAGIVVEFWIHGLSLLMKGKSGHERTLPEHYREWFTLVLRNTTPNGGLGRTLLASQLTFLFGLDEDWSKENIVPLFTDPDRKRFIQSWYGFLTWGKLNTPLAEVLTPAILTAMQRLSTDLPPLSDRFVKFCAELALFYVANPPQEFLPKLFENGSLKDRCTFASHLGWLLRRMEQSAKQQLWEGWLQRYWENRLEGVPAQLSPEEIQKMLDWLPDLGTAYPLAVSLAVRFPPVHIKNNHLLFSLQDQENNIVTLYQTATANLLIYLCGCQIERYQVPDLNGVASRLTELPPELRRRLDEAILKL